MKNRNIASQFLQNRHFLQNPNGYRIGTQLCNIIPMRTQPIPGLETCGTGCGSAGNTGRELYTNQFSGELAGCCVAVYPV